MNLTQPFPVCQARGGPLSRCVTTHTFVYDDEVLFNVGVIRLSSNPGCVITAAPPKREASIPFYLRIGRFSNQARHLSNIFD